jgi:hypothetical protein
MADLEERLRELFAAEARSRTVHRVEVVPKRPPSRWLVVMAGAALALLAVVAAGRFLAQREEPSFVTTSPTPTASPTGATPSPAPTSDPSVARHVRPLVETWAPTGTTVIAVVHSGTQRPGGGTQMGEFTLVAIPSTGGAAVPLITMREGAGFAFSPDGSHLAMSITVTPLDAPLPSSRLALWNLRSGILSWLSPEDPGGVAQAPVWSPDGGTVYYGAARYGSNQQLSDLGIFRIRRDGGQPQQLLPALPAGMPPLVSIPLRVTDEGLLIWGRAYEGSSLEVTELATGRQHMRLECAALLSWRPTRPRALVDAPACGTGSGGRALLWDEVSGEQKQLVDPSRERGAGADWDPTGTRIVLSTRATTRDDPFRLVVSDAQGEGRRTVGGSEHARMPLWLRAGIAYVWAMPEPDDPTLPFARLRPPYELRVISPDGGTPRTLYRSNDPIVALRFVSP